MTDLREALTREAERLHPTLDLDDVLDRSRRRQRRHRRRLAGLGIAVAIALLALGTAVWAGRPSPDRDVVTGPPPATAVPATPPGVEIAGGDLLHGTLERRDPTAADGAQTVVVRAADGSLAHHSAVVTWPADAEATGTPVVINGQPGHAADGVVTWSVDGKVGRVRGDLGADALIAIARATTVDPTTQQPDVPGPPPGLHVVARGPAGTPVQREARYGSVPLGEGDALGAGLALAVSATGGAIEDYLLEHHAPTDVFVQGHRAAWYDPDFTAPSPPLLLGGNGTLVWENSPGVLVAVGYSGSSSSPAAVAALTRLGERVRIVDETAWVAGDPQVVPAR